MNSSVKDTSLSTFCYESVPNERSDQLNSLMLISIGTLRKGKASFEMRISKIYKLKSATLSLLALGRRNKLCNADTSAEAIMLITLI